MSRKVVVIKTTSYLQNSKAIFMKLGNIIDKMFTEIWYIVHLSGTTYSALKIDLKSDDIAANWHDISKLIQNDIFWGIN